MSGVGGVLRTRALVRVALAMAGVLGCVGALAPAASAATPVTCGSTISAPGSYFLAANCTGPGITITSSNVTLQLNGHTMTSSAIGQIGVSVDDSAGPVFGVKILGPGRITGYGGGVALGILSGAGVTNSTVGGLTTDHNGQGISLGHATGDSVYGNTASNNLVDGIFLSSDATGNAIQANTVNSNGLRGIVVVGDRNAINANTAANNATSGIEVFSSTGNKINANTADHNADGIAVKDQATANTINGNTADYNTEDGIVVQSAATSNTVNGNTALHNSADDLADINPGCDSNKWNGDIFKTRNQACVH